MVNEQQIYDLKPFILGIVIIALTLVFGIYIVATLSTTLDSSATASIVNESDNSGAVVILNHTGYTLRGYNSSLSSIITTAVWANLTATGNTPYFVPSANYTTSSTGVLNITTITNQTQYNNASVSYTYVNDSASQTAASDAQTNTTRAVPLVGILFIILAVATIITLLIVSLLGRKKA